SPRASLDHTLSIARPRSLRALHPLPTRRSSALLADPGDLPSHARVDLRQHVRTEYLREVNSARHSAELENGDLMLRMLAEGDLIHPAGGVDREGDVPTDETHDRGGCGHREPADARGLCDRRVAGVGIGVLDAEGTEVETFGDLRRAGVPPVTGAGELDAEVRAVAGHGDDESRAGYPLRRCHGELARGHDEVEREVVVRPEEARHFGEVVSGKGKGEGLRPD